MPHVIITHDKPDHAHLRTAHQLEHRRYLDEHCKQLLLAAGAMFDETGAVAKGSVLLLDTDERTVAEEFVRNDPFTKAGLFASITIAPWRKAFFNFETLVPLK